MEAIKAGKKIGDLEGRIISLRHARKKAKSMERVSIVEFGDGRALDASDNSTCILGILHDSCKVHFLLFSYFPEKF
jgi:hypothetical protein